MRAVRVLAAVVVLACTVWAILRVTVAPYRCDYARGEVALFVSSIDSIDSDYDRTVQARSYLAQVRSCLAVCPTNVYDLVYEGVLLYTLGAPDEAIAAYERVLRHHHRPELYVDLASMELERGLRERAIDHLVMATRFDRFAMRYVEKKTGFLLPKVTGLEEEVYARVRREDPEFQAPP